MKTELRIKQTYCMKCGNYGHVKDHCEYSDTGYINKYYMNKKDKHNKINITDIPALLIKKEKEGYFVCKLCNSPFSEKKYCEHHLQTYCIGLYKNKCICCI